MNDLDLPYLGLKRDLHRIEDPHPKKTYSNPIELLNIQDPIRVDPGLLGSIDDRVAYRRSQETSYDPTQAMGHAQGIASFKAYRVSEERPYSKTTGEVL
tara:strand:+ start:516 stop:812 length:297 start_codon:yes stop_codon:yes gene_type:complete